MVLEGEKLFEWTNFYMDVMSDRMLTTVTLPVYNNTFNGKNQSIVGVMGVDVTDEELRKMEPSAQLGPGGYSFCTDHDGYIVFHPGLPTQVDYLDDPPHYDLTDVEINNKDIIEQRVEKFSNNMIDRRSGNATLDVYIKMLDKKCIIPQRLRYYYTPVDQTTFSVAIVLPENRNFHLEAKGMNLTKGGQDLNEAEKEGVLISPWPFCWDEIIEGNQTVAQQNLSATLKSQPSKYWGEVVCYDDFSEIQTLIEKIDADYAVNTGRFCERDKNILTEIDEIDLKSIIQSQDGNSVKDSEREQNGKYRYARSLSKLENVLKLEIFSGPSDSTLDRFYCMC
ncbi:voltage-dependent calcium channel subunit alpha-2/delta-2-like [Tachypleus tridentatus]|uniref:voltage-dependent calcium channel subunit alpha-2/delta-2-like n=1 Tax=Tachypleus tridentatus TaxID=6853 RepID=UPI003FD40F3C